MQRACSDFALAAKRANSFIALGAYSCAKVLISLVALLSEPFGLPAPGLAGIVHLIFSDLISAPDAQTPEAVKLRAQISGIEQMGTSIRAEVQGLSMGFSPEGWWLKSGGAQLGAFVGEFLTEPFGVTLHDGLHYLV